MLYINQKSHTKMPKTFNYKKEFFTRPILTTENLRFWAIIAIVGFFYFSFAITAIRWATNLSSEQIFSEIQKGYQAFLLDLEIENLNIESSLSSQTQLIYDPDLNIEKYLSTIEKVSTPRRSVVRRPRREDLYPNLEIEAIASAVRSVPGYPRVAPYQARQERVLTYDDRKDVFRSHNDQISIPLPQTIKFASSNGNRDLYETTAIIEMNESDIKFCFERATRYNPGFSGNILISFTIHPDGYVIPSSIKIVKSDISDSRILNCIVKSMRRWRNFKRLAYEEGSYTITRKYIF